MNGPAKSLVGPGEVPPLSCEQRVSRACETRKPCAGNAGHVSAVMKRVAGLILLLSVVCHETDGVYLKNQNQNSTDVLDAVVFSDLSAVIRRVDPRFLSVTVDASLAADEKFMYLLRLVSVCL